MFIKCIFAQKSSFLLTQSIQLCSPRLRAVQSHCSRGYSCPALASASNDQAAKAAMSVLERVENYSENLTLVTRRDRAWVRPSIQMQTTLFQRRGAVSNIASKFPGPETRTMQPARKRSDRTNPGEQAGKRLLQPNGWLRSILDLRESERSASVRSEWYRWNRSWRKFAPGTGCGRGFKGHVLSHSDSTASQTLSEVCSRGHSVPVPCSPWASFGPRALSRSAWTQLLPSPQSERHADFRAVVRTSEPVAHKPLGAGSSVVSSKDFQPQLKQRHVLIHTYNMSVFSYIITKEEYDPTSMQRIPCYERTVTFSQSEQRTSPVFWTAGQTCFRGRGFLKESGGCTLSRFGWFGLATGQRRWICSPRARECTLPAVRLPVSLPAEGMAEGGRADIALASSQAVY